MSRIPDFEQLPWCVCGKQLPWCVCGKQLPWCVCGKRAVATVRMTGRLDGRDASQVVASLCLSPA